MSDDFGTVNIRRGERAREIELLRQHYRQHRDALAQMTSEAPTDYLAGEYQRLIREIDNAIAKLDELEGHGKTVAATPPMEAPHGDPLRAKTEPGSRNLITPPSVATAEPASAWEVTPQPSGSGARVAMIVIAAIIVLGIIGWLIYRASGERHVATDTASSTTSITESTTPVTSTAPGTIEPVNTTTATSPLSVRPALVDYATIHKGTRATRQIEVTNNSSAPVSFSVSRSQCKCLYYEYKDTVAAKAKETVTVTVDGARAKAGTLQETLELSGKKDNAPLATVQVIANIK